MDIVFGEGISKEGDLIDLGVINGLVEKSGSWLSYGEDRIGQGRENAKKFLRDYPEISEELENKLREKIGLPQVSVDNITPVEKVTTDKSEVDNQVKAKSR